MSIQRILLMPISIIPIHMEKDVNTNDDLIELILSSINKERQKLHDNDILVITHKIISKAHIVIVFSFYSIIIFFSTVPSLYM